MGIHVSHPQLECREFLPLLSLGQVETPSQHSLLDLLIRQPPRIPD